MKTLFTILFLFAALGLSAQTVRHCQAETAKHLPCKNLAVKGTEFCYQHTKANQCEFIRANGERCRKNANVKKGEKFCYLHKQ